jgi:hypothetical protein
MSNTKSRTFAFEDVIYGPQIEKRSRAQTHLKRLEGVMHLSRRSPLIAKKGEPIRLTVTTSGDKPFRAVTCRYRIDGRVEKEVVFNKGEVSWDDLAWTYVRYWYAEIPAVEKTSEVVYRIGALRRQSNIVD